ncbi:MAG: phosphoribosylformylglycinamidine synthase subunit PurS [Gemmatimonadota bacterium]|nr:phosphoribosylformylglycinamidine synthase subunit PurS [Gemmatimonadota bacterium]
MSDTYSVEVRITPRQGILDPEGETIARALENLGYAGVNSVRAGRLVRMEVDAASADGARSMVEKMCEELIANPVIEDYEVLVHEGEPVG